MNPIKTFEELRRFNLTNCEQYWYYVIILNPKDITKAGQAVLDNLNIFHLDSGNSCHYFIPGFENTGSGLFSGLLNPFDRMRGNVIDIPGFGGLKFFEEEFVRFYQELEMHTRAGYTGWRYSGECELLIFNVTKDGQIELSDFASYNLDDIVRNGRKVSEFIRTTINVGKDASDQVKAKCILDEKFYEMIMPDKETTCTAEYQKGWDILQQKGFADSNYYFISYSTKDFNIVSEIRKRLCDHGISCWMAPYDIPGGTNYAWIIEHAIQHAGKFVLMLSENSAESVWVGKELKRAISLFQQKSPEKLCVVWLHHIFPLSSTPLALPLEDVQINVDLGGNAGNYMMIVDSENKAKSKEREHMEEIERLLSPAYNVKQLEDILDHIHAIAIRNVAFMMHISRTYALYEQIKHEIECMRESEYIYDYKYLSHYRNVMDMLHELMDILQR